jgi:D-proline reductase (dithiol) PrdB
MPRIEDLTEVQRQTVLNCPCFEYDDAPFVPLNEPLSEVRLRLVTTAGMHLRDDKPFTAGDQSYRAIPSIAAASEIIQSHNSIGFNRTAVYRDLNLTFPVE